MASANTETRTPILSNARMRLLLPLNQTTALHTTSKSPIRMKEKNTMPSVTKRNQQGCGPGRLAGHQAGWAKWAKGLGTLFTFKDQSSALLIQNPQRCLHHGRTDSHQLSPTARNIKQNTNLLLYKEEYVFPKTIYSPFSSPFQSSRSFGATQWAWNQSTPDWVQPEASCPQ